jgi:hypothetical protein
MYESGVMDTWWHTLLMAHDHISVSFLFDIHVSPFDSMCWKHNKI